MDSELIIDGDGIMYTVGFASEGEPINYVLGTVKKYLDRIQSETGASKRSIYIKGTGNFRDEVAVTQPYKGTRTNAKPSTYEDIVSYLISYQGATKVDGMEADDRVSYLLYQDYLASGGDKDKATLILSSRDKDLKNTPGWHHNPDTSQVYWVTDEQALRHFWWQMLQGDSSDSIPGLPSIPEAYFKKFGLRKTKNNAVGKGTATKLMQVTCTAEAAELLVWELYIAHGDEQGWSDSVTKDYFLEQATLLWMTREMNGDEPVRYQINEELYERARKRWESNRYPHGVSERAHTDGGDAGEAEGDSGYSVKGRLSINVRGTGPGDRSDDSDQSNDALSIRPYGSDG
jgi:hypothetical protein